MFHKLQRLKSRLNKQQTIGLVVAVVVAGIGIYFLASSHAASPFVSSEAESGTVASPATTISDSNASGGSAVKFGSSSGAGNFSISGNQILSPTGQPYVPVGINANGLDWVWNGPTIGKSSVAHDSWKFNFMRLNSCYAGAKTDSCNFDWTNNNNIASIVNEYTSKKIVIDIALHEFTGSTPDSNFIPWWTTLINQFKSNPYVWFEPLNEPGGSASQLNTIYTQFVSTARGLGAQNMIVLDGVNYSADSNSYSCGSALDGTSLFLSASMKNLESQYGNLLPTVHVYQIWGGGGSGCTAAQLDTRFTAFINAVHAVPLPIFIGEQGSPPNGDDVFPYQGVYPANQMGFRLAPSLGIGLVYWHGDCGSSYCPMKSGNWSDINSATNPTNLQWDGLDLFNYAHSNPARGY